MKEQKKEKMSLILFSGDLDKALAAFHLSTGATTMGMDSCIFFTFWGINLLRKKENKVAVKKNFIDKLFGSMMPKGPTDLKLSKMNMGGLGTKMMKKIMKDKDQVSLDTLMKTATDAGVKFIACTSSMEMMGICKEELIENIELGSVATYLKESIDADIRLFI